MEEQKVVCPVCGSEVEEDECYDYEIYINETVVYCTGTCKKCKEIVDYNRIYPHKNCEIKVVNHYKD